MTGRQRWIIGLLVLPTFVTAMDMTVLALAIPALSADLAPTGPQLLWITDAYGFSVGALLVTMGSLGDRIGRRRLLLIGAGGFAIASMGAAFAPSAEALIAARVLLGITAATLMPSTMALLRDAFPDEGQRTQAIIIWMMAFMAGSAMGPLIGGLMIQIAWWGAVFLVGVPAMVLLLIAGPRHLPRGAGTGGVRIDLLSAILLAAAIVSTVHGIKDIAHAEPSLFALVSVVLGLALGLLFARRQLHLADPLLDLSLFRSPVFSGSVVIQTLGVFSTGGVQFLLAQYLQLSLQLSPTQAGLLTVPGAIGGILSSLVAPRLAARFTAPRVIVAGLILTASGLGLIAGATGSDILPLIVIGSAVMACGFGPVMALTTALIVSSVPAEKTGAAAATSETAGELGVSLGVAVLGSVALSTFRSQFTSSGPNDPPETFAGAVDAAGRLPLEEGQAMVEASRAAFETAQVTVVLIAAGVVVMLSVVALATLRPPRRTDLRSHDPQISWPSPQDPGGPHASWPRDAGDPPHAMRRPDRRAAHRPRWTVAASACC